MDNAAKNGFFLRTIVFAIICAFSFFVPLSSAFAATDNQTSGEIMTPQVTAEDLKVESSLTGGSTVPFSFTLNNVENRGFFDIGYRVYVLDSKKDIYLQKDFPKLYVLAPFEKRNIESSFDLPKAIFSGDYVLQVEAISPSGSGLGGIQSKVKINGTDSGAVTFGNVSISSGSQKSPDAGGIAVNPGDNVVAGIFVNSKKDLNLKEQYKIYPEENFSEGTVAQGGQRLIKSGLGKYDLSVKSPGNGGNFTMAYWLVDSDGLQVSPIKKFMWGAWGTTPAINYLAVDKTSAKKGENIDVEIALIPPVARENIGEVTVKVWVGDSYAEKNLDFSKTAVVLVPVLLKNDVNEPVVRVVVEKDGKGILDYKTISKGDLSKNNSAETVNEPESNGMLYLGLGMFFVASMVLAFYFVKSRKNAAKIAVFLLFGFTFIFLAQKDAFATTDSGASWGSVPAVSGTCSPASSYFNVQNFFIYKNGSGTAAAQNTIFRPGDTIRFNGSMRPGSGSCTYFGTGSATHRIGSVDLGSTSGQSWDVTYTIPATYDNISYKNTYARTSWYGSIRSSGTAGTVNAYKSMTITMGPQAVDGVSLGVSALPSCSNSNYNATFSFTGRALAENYDINWATDSAFTANYGSVTTGLNGAGAKSYTTTTAPFAVGPTYYWRVNARNSNVGSDVTTVAALTMGPVAACPAPTVTLTAQTNPINFNLSTILFWAITNATSCTNGANMPASATWPTGTSGGEIVGPLLVNTTYTLNCTGPGGSASHSLTETVRPAQPVPHGCQADFNADGVINSADQTILAANYTPANPYNSRYDINEDDNVNSSDYTQVSRLALWNYPCAVPAPLPPTPPACVSDNFGSDLSFYWAWSGVGLQSSDIRVSATTTYTVLASKNVSGGSLATTGASGWSGGLTSGGALSLLPNTLYYWSVRTIADGFTTSYSFNAKIPATPTCAPPANPSGLTAVFSCNGSSPEVLFTFTDNSNSEDRFWLDVNGAAWTGPAGPSPWGVKTITRTGTDKTGTGAVTYTWNASDPLSGTPTTPTGGTTYYWRVKANNAAGDSAHVYPPASTTVPGTPFTTLACDPDLTIRNSTDGTSPIVTVSASASISGTTITVPANTNFTMTFNTRNVGTASAGASCTIVEAFSSTLAGPINTCTAVTTNGKQWFPAGVLAVNTSAFHSLTTSYTTAGTYPNGIMIRANASGSVLEPNWTNNQVDLTIVVTSPSQYDLQVVEFVPGTWKDSALNSVDPTVGFQPRDKIKVDVKVQNAATSFGNSPSTMKLDFYYLSTLSRPNCPGTAITTAPTDGATPAASQRYNVPILAPGASTTIPVEFTIGTTGSTAYAYIDPGCNINDPDWSSNFKSQTYLTNTVGFFETLGGDVGAAVGKEVRVSYNSSVIPKYQSDYVIAGNVHTNVRSKNGWILNNYNKRQAPSAGIYDYFINKFPNPNPADSSCAFTPVKLVAYCNGNFSGGGNPTGSRAIFVNDNLEIHSDIILDSDEAVVFIVRGDIIVDTSVKRIDGIYIARHSFIDHNTADPALAASTDALTVNGAIYVDGKNPTNGNIDGTIDIGRYFSAALNNQYAPVKVVYDPKYVMLMRDLIGVKSIKWAEVNP